MRKKLLQIALSLILFVPVMPVHAESAETEPLPEETAETVSESEDNAEASEPETEETPETPEEENSESEVLPEEEEISEPRMTEPAAETEPEEPEETEPEVPVSEEMEEVSEPEDIIEETEDPEEITEETDVPEEPEEGFYQTGDMLEEDESGYVLMDDSDGNVFHGIRTFKYNQTEGRRILKIINNFRKDSWYWNESDTEKIKVSADPLEYDYGLEQIAMQRAAEIAVYFAHTRPDGSAWYDAAAKDAGGALYYSNGENILWGSGYLADSAEAAFDIWKEEKEKYKGQGHRRNMLSKDFTAMGIGYAQVGDIGYWVTEFRRRKTPLPETEPFDGSMPRAVSVYTSLISSISDYKTDPSKYYLAPDQTAPIPEVTAKFKVSSNAGALTFSDAVPQSMNIDLSDKSSNVIELTEEGMIHALNYGSVDLLISIPTGKTPKKITVPVNVVKRATGITIDCTEKTIDRGSEFTLTATVLPEDASDRTCTWSSSDPSVAQVSKDGTVTGKGAGTAVITATSNDGGFTASCKVTVEVHVTGIELDQSYSRMREGMHGQLTYQITPEDAPDQTVRWQSSDESVVTVDDNGELSAVSPGTAVITVTTADREKSDFLEITVSGMETVSAPVLYWFDEAGERHTAESGIPFETGQGTVLALECATAGASIFVETDGETELYSSPFKAEREGVIKAYASKDGFKTSDTAEYILHFRDESVEADPGDLTEEDIEEVIRMYDGIVPDGLWVSGIDEEAVYNGKKITFPNLRVYDHKTLLNSSFYTVSYKNNINVSAQTADRRIGWVPEKKSKVPYVQIKGKGSYTGTVYVPFNILAKDIASDEIEATDIVVKKSSKVQKPLPSVIRGTGKLSVNKDFTVVYKDSSGKEYTYAEGIKEAGEYTVIISGTGNYSGTRIAKVTIDDDPDVILISKPKITIAAYKAENGMPVTKDSALSIKITNGNKTLSQDTVRVTAIRNGDRPGKALVTLEGSGTADPMTGIRLAGTRTVSMKITGRSISKAAAVFKPVSFTGLPVCPKDFTVTLGETVLVKDIDYQITGYASNIKAGKKAKVTVAGIGKYSGKKTFTFTIGKTDLSQAEAVIDETADYTPSGASVVKSLKLGEYILKNGTDYTVKYTLNKAAGTASYIVSGKGSMTGTLNGEFTVTKHPLNETVLTVNDVSYDAKKKGSYYRPKFTLKYGKIKLGTKDYDSASVSYTYEQDVWVKSGKKTELRFAGDPVKDTDTVPEGSALRLRISARETGNYSGDISCVYRVVAKPYQISSASVKFRVTGSDGTEKLQKSLTKEYTGRAVMLEESELCLTVKISGSTYELQPQDYEIVSYSSNIKKGTAKAVIKGTGKFGGTKTVSFKIGSAKFRLIDVLSLN